MTETEVERLIDKRLSEVLEQLTWNSVYASGAGMFQPPVRTITVDGCRHVIKELLRKWFQKGADRA